MDQLAAINRLKGTVADLLQPRDIPTPDFLALSVNEDRAFLLWRERFDALRIDWERVEKMKLPYYEDRS